MGCSNSRIPGKIELYYMAPSPPCRSVMLTAHSLGIKLVMKSLNLLEGEHLKPEFVKINPCHTVPTLNDEGFILWESRAICSYLVNMYGKDDSLYPKDPRKRALVDSRLDFDQGTIWSCISEKIKSVISGDPQSEESIKKTHDAYTLFNILLDKQTWVAGENVTIADFALVASISTADGVGHDFKPYPNIARWLEYAKANMKGYKEMNQFGIDMFKLFFDDMQKKKQTPTVHVNMPKEEEIKAANLINEAVKTPPPTSDEEPKLNMHT